jgi:hypothetical protein
MHPHALAPARAPLPELTNPTCRLYPAFSTSPENDAPSRSASVELAVWDHKTPKAAEARDGHRAAFLRLFARPGPGQGHAN